MAARRLGRSINMSKTKKDRKKWLSFAILVLSAGVIYKLYFMEDAFYVQMQEVWGLTNTQIGIIYSVTGWISTFGFLVSAYLSERFSKRKLIPIAMIVNGLAGLALTTNPSFPVMLAIFCVFPLCADMMFWPTMLKAVRLLGTKDEQGRMFGILESGRGLIDTIVNFIALGIFAALGGSLLAFNVDIIFFSVLNIGLGIACYFLLEDDEIAKIKDSGEKNKKAFSNMMAAMKNPAIWLAAFNVFSVYIVYSGIKYFSPYLRECYGLPIVAASAYAIINSYVLKMVGGPIGGVVSDKVTHSAAKFIRFMFILDAAGLLLFIAMSYKDLNVFVVMAVALMISAFIFCQRSVFFAPMDEIDVPREITGSAMSLGSFIGYLPGAFMGIVYGHQLDAHPGVVGYRRVFTIMLVLSLCGLIVSSALVHVINKKKAAKAAVPKEG
jgi:sugar phosphate permease